MRSIKAFIVALLLAGPVSSPVAHADDPPDNEPGFLVHPTTGAINPVDAGDAPPMLEKADPAPYPNNCLNAMMSTGCRISSQIPFWNQFVAAFTFQAGIACPISATTRAN